MAQDYQRRPAQFSYENAELKRLPLRSERMELMARALETLAQARELLIKVDETLARKMDRLIVPSMSAFGTKRHWQSNFAVTHKTSDM